MTVTRGQVLRYLFLPGMRPRLGELFLSGFQMLPYLLALVYGAVRLLPPSHPYLNAANVGRFGIRHVIAEAANNLALNPRAVDQIILFFVILIGWVMMLIQLGLLAIMLVFKPASAMAAATMPTSFEGFFITENDGKQDLAYMFMDLVFGVPDVFESCISTQDCVDLNGDLWGPVVVSPGGGGTTREWVFAAFGNWPYPIHQALHSLFQFYSIGLLVVAAFITTYFIITIIAETAQTGTPFGKRFNKVWAPIRVVVAFGLLIPVGVGYNSGQYIVFYAAKFGSGFASNGWVLFNDTLNAEYLGDDESLISQPNIPEVGGLLQFLFTARTCAEAYALSPYPDIDYEVADGAADIPPADEHRMIAPYLVKSPGAVGGSGLEVVLGYDPTEDLPTSVSPADLGTTYADMIDFVDRNPEAIIRFGVKDEEAYPGRKGHVEPICGDLVIPLYDPRPEADASPAATDMQKYYWFIIKEIWYGTLYPQFIDFAKAYAVRKVTGHDEIPTAYPLPENDFKAEMQKFYSRDLEAAMLNPPATNLVYYAGLSADGALEAQRNAGAWNVEEPLKDKGWAAAGIWYNRIAQMNGEVTAAVFNVPIVARYPNLMEFVFSRKRVQDQQVDFATRYEPKLASGEAIHFNPDEDGQLAGAMYEAFAFWEQDGKGASTHTRVTGNAFVDLVNNLFGTSGLFSMRKNDNVHPLAKLVGIGRSLVESTIRNVGFAAAGGVGGQLLKSLGMSSEGGITTAFASLMVTISMIGLSVGFILFYIIPFLPFIYFFFAVGGWVKGIFEALVGAPLWALAHIRIDGEGLPGQAGVAGYFLVFEIFLRPILIVFGLLASISIFSALVAVLNDIWDLVVGNVGGFDIVAEQTIEAGADPATSPGALSPQTLGEFFRGPIDEFFFTIVYAIVVYMMGMASFKLIDLIPKSILRWMGSSVTAFNDDRDDPAQGLISRSYIGAQQTLGGIGGALNKAIGTKIPTEG